MSKKKDEKRMTYREWASHDLKGCLFVGIPAGLISLYLTISICNLLGF